MAERDPNYLRRQAYQCRMLSAGDPKHAEQLTLAADHIEELERGWREVWRRKNGGCNEWVHPKPGDARWRCGEPLLPRCDTCTAQAREIEELEKDKARLQWLQDAVTIVECVDIGDALVWWTINKRHEGDTLRAAIDAARGEGEG